MTGEEICVEGVGERFMGGVGGRVGRATPWAPVGSNGAFSMEIRRRGRR